FSFWGHNYTLNAVNSFLGVDLTPNVERPVIILNDEKLPTLENIVFTECWIVSPNYKQNFRPIIGQEVSADCIESWQILKITWE
ncbi:MAG: hypothetical protein ACRC37_00940, partial [Lentisphaeria bacterium]